MFRVEGFRGLGFRGLGFRGFRGSGVSGFRGLGFGGLGFRSLRGQTPEEPSSMNFNVRATKHENVTTQESQHDPVISRHRNHKSLPTQKKQKSKKGLKQLPIPFCGFLIFNIVERAPKTRF